MPYPVGEHIPFAQGTDEWKAARVGSLGGSQVSDALARIKTGWGASRANILATLIAERLTGIAADSFTNAAMQRGTEKEPDARLAYEFECGVTVKQVGIFRHPALTGTHASPDGLVADDGCVEIKVPNTSTHIDTLLSETIADKYIKQMQWEMACSGRAWCDYISFDDRLPPDMRLFVKRVPRDEQMIEEMERDIAGFLKELDDKIAALSAKFARAA